MAAPVSCPLPPGYPPGGGELPGRRGAGTDADVVGGDGRTVVARGDKVLHLVDPAATSSNREKAGTTL